MEVYKNTTEQSARLLLWIACEEVAGSASGGCTYGPATTQTLGEVRSCPTTEEEEELIIDKFLLAFTSSLSEPCFLLYSVISIKLKQKPLRSTA